MQKFAAMTTESAQNSNDDSNENGLQNLVMYYQSLFDRDENLNHYSADDYQSAKRKFVKYLLDTRAM